MESVTYFHGVHGSSREFTGVHGSSRKFTEVHNQLSPESEVHGTKRGREATNISFKKWPGGPVFEPKTGLPGHFVKLRFVAWKFTVVSQHVAYAC